MFNRLMSRIKNLFVIGEVTGASTQSLQVKISTGKTNDRIKRLHNYGFMSRPKVGARSYNLFLGGVMSRGISFCVEDERYQIELEEGEVAMMDDKGNLVHFTKNGIDIKTPKNVNITCNKATLTASKTTVNGDVDINGNVNVKGGDVLVDGISVKGHTHKETGSGGGETLAPS